MGATAKTRADELPQLGDFQRLGVEGRRYVLFGGPQQDPLQCLSGRQSIGRRVTVRHQQHD
ncbi:hypothetical protein, partial [Actinomadura sp. HBU206391]|uniref:hypothetical protein n=1 Tax=Actinomadura sp. HBU206391 TaxID=2731692 RepID=UPI00164F449D